jgi:hypothetical protein
VRPADIALRVLVGLQRHAMMVIPVDMMEDGFFGSCGRMPIFAASDKAVPPCYDLARKKLRFAGRGRKHDTSQRNIGAPRVWLAHT